MGCAPTTRIVDPGFDLPEGDPEAGRAAFVRLDCVACHRVSGDPGLPDPREPVPFALGEGVASRPTDARLVTSIINPHRNVRLPYKRDVVTEDGKSRMTDYADVMRVQELIDIVAYLRTVYDRGYEP